MIALLADSFTLSFTMSLWSSHKSFYCVVCLCTIFHLLLLFLFLSPPTFRVLYQQQNQPMDALQAYICAVQLDKNHSAAWTNLGKTDVRVKPNPTLKSKKITRNNQTFFLFCFLFVLVLGILYETSNQPRDGLACYVNAARGSASKNHGKAVHPNLLQRTKFLQQQLEGAPTPTSFNKSVSLHF
jgi:hypothetical protein